MSDKTLNLTEAAKELNITRQTLSKWIKKGKIPFIRPTNEYFIKEKDLRAFMNEDAPDPKEFPHEEGY
jgi:excisionase family DNA binding protein